ncbi:hypothetical protein PanWU01x14_265010 [Parasponia andersonii]|uniref:F-box associated domain n=1 Tax=Parasponia andersonii TaxID=3476 RepID=A0A2P5B785_PARAD|nr:hypothetical protein PanWU01x14_265010 [Parasponia andersonii]
MTPYLLPRTSIMQRKNPLSVANDYKFVNELVFGEVKAECQINFIIAYTFKKFVIGRTMLGTSLGKMIILCEEVFHIVPFPKVAYYSSSLVVWNDSVALFLSSQETWNSNSMCLEMWVVDDYFDVVKGTAYSPLTKCLVFGPLVDFPLPLRFWKSTDDLLLEDGRDEKLLTYNLRT